MTTAATVADPTITDPPSIIKSESGPAPSTPQSDEDCSSTTSCIIALQICSSTWYEHTT